jgi:hypothetical protein
MEDVAEPGGKLEEAARMGIHASMHARVLRCARAGEPPEPGGDHEEAATVEIHASIHATTPRSVYAMTPRYVHETIPRSVHATIPRSVLAGAPPALEAMWVCGGIDDPAIAKVLAAKAAIAVVRSSQKKERLRKEAVAAAR